MVDKEIVENVALEAKPIIDQWSAELLAWAKSGSGFVTEQIPLLVKEIIRWGLAEKAIYCSIGIILLSLGIILFRYLHTHRSWLRQALNSYNEDVPAMSLCILTLAANLVGALIFFINLHDFIKILVAPRLYLIEYLSQLVK